MPFKKLSEKYIKENFESDLISWGTFVVLKPFYVRHTSSKDMKTCSGLDKSHTYICYILKIINFADCHTCLFSNKYVHEHNFSVSRVHEVILRN